VHHRRAGACEVRLQNSQEIVVRIALMQEQRLAAVHRQFQLTFEGTLLRMTRCDSPRCRWRVSSKARATLANFI